MKKLFLAATGLLSIAATAQQLPNNGFEEAWGDCTPWTASGNTKTKGVQPAPWTISHVIGVSGLGATEVGSKVGGYNSASAVEVKNAANPLKSSEIVPGFVTLGTPWSTSKGMMTVTNKDGGTFGGIEFNKRPDQLSFKYKRAHANGSTQPFTVVAYAWKGSTSQADVPATIATVGSPKTCTMNNRDRNILGIDTSEGGAVTKSDDFDLIACINDNSLTDAKAEWTTYSKMLDYKSDAVPTMFNVVFAANNYFSSENIIEGDALDIDDVNLYYFSRCNAVTINGQALPDWNANTYEYTAEGELPSADQVTCTTYGKAATSQVIVDPEASTVTIKVTNSDGPDTDGLSEHSYVITYPKKEQGQQYTGKLDITMAGSLIADGQDATISITPLSDNTCKFVLPNFTLSSLGLELGDIVIPEMNMATTEGRTTYTGSVESLQLLGGMIEASVAVNGYIATNGDIDMKIDVVWKSEDGDIPIDVRFYAGNVVPDYSVHYNGYLDIMMAGETLAEKQDAEVKILATGENLCTFILPNFTLASLGMQLGDIVVPDVKTSAGTDRTLYEGKVEGLQLLDGMISANVSLSGYIATNGDIDMKIDVVWTSEDGDIPIDVWFYAGDVTPNHGSTAITTLDADSATAVYYDLSGRRIVNPQHGLFIKKEGSKAAKVIL